MKHFLLMLGIIFCLSFSVTGCSEATDNKDSVADKATGENRNTVESIVEKTKEEVDAAGKSAQHAIDDTKKIAGEVLESTTERTLDDAKDILSDAEQDASSISSEKSTAVADIIEMKNTEAFSAHKMGIVMFGHKKHTAAAPDGYGIVCGECHHDKDGKPLEIKEGDAVQGCMACHDKADKPKKPEGISKEDWEDLQLTYYYGAVHANCINCHRASGAGPVKCAECHLKPEE